MAGLFADETRVRVFAAVALGATSAAEVVERTGLPARKALLALRRLEEREVVAADADGLAVSYDSFRRLAREAAGPRPARDHGTGDELLETVLRTFVRDGRLVKLPAQWNRKKLVLRRIAERTFEPGREYAEKEVDERLRAWCEGGRTDHVTPRRYLVDLHHLHRSDGVYRRPAEEAATQPVTERTVTAGSGKDGEIPKEAGEASVSLARAGNTMSGRRDRRPARSHRTVGP